MLDVVCVRPPKLDVGEPKLGECGTDGGGLSRVGRMDTMGAGEGVRALRADVVGGEQRPAGVGCG